MCWMGKVMPGPQVEVTLNTHGLESQLKRKSNEVGPRLIKLLNDSARDVARNVKRKSPHVTGKLKSSITHTIGGNGGVVYANESIAPYVDYVVNGRRGFCAKNKQALYWKGASHPVRCVKASKPNPIFEKGYEISGSDIQKRCDEFITWASNI